MIKIVVGDYVWVTRWSDQDPNDPWHVGYVQETGLPGLDSFYIKVNNRWWKHYMKITEEQGLAILRTYPSLEKNINTNDHTGKEIKAGQKAIEKGKQYLNEIERLLIRKCVINSSLVRE